MGIVIRMRALRSGLLVFPLTVFSLNPLATGLICSPRKSYQSARTCHLPCGQRRHSSLGQCYFSQAPSRQQSRHSNIITHYPLRTAIKRFVDFVLASQLQLQVVRPGYLAPDPENHDPRPRQLPKHTQLYNWKPIHSFSEGLGTETSHT